MERAQWSKILTFIGAWSLLCAGCLPANQANTASIVPGASTSSTSSGKKSLADALSGNSSSSSSSSSTSDGALGQCKTYAVGSNDRTVCRNCYTQILNEKCSGKTYETCPDPVAKLAFTSTVNTCIQNSLAAGFVCTKTCSTGLILNGATCTCQVPVTTIGNAGDSLVDVGAENFGPPIASLYIPSGNKLKTNTDSDAINSCEFTMNPLHFIVKNRGDTIRSGNNFSAEFQSCKFLESVAAPNTWTSFSTTAPVVINTITAPIASTSFGDVYDGTFHVASNGLDYYASSTDAGNKFSTTSFRGATYAFDKDFVAGAPVIAGGVNTGGNMFEWPDGLTALGVVASRKTNAFFVNFLGNLNQDGGDDGATLDPNLQFEPRKSDGVTQTLLSPGIYHLSFKLILLDDWKGSNNDETFNVDYTLSTGGGAVPLLIDSNGDPYTFTTDPANYSQTFPGSPLWNGRSGFLTAPVATDDVKDAVYQIDLDVTLTAAAGTGITFDFYNDSLASSKTRAVRSWGIKDFKFFLKSTYHPQCGIKYTFTDSNQQESKYCFRFLPRTNCDGANCICYADPVNGGPEGSFFFPMDNQQSCP